MHLCEDCGNIVYEVKMYNGLLVCPPCYESRSGLCFKKFHIPKIDRRRQLVGKKRRIKAR